MMMKDDQPSICSAPLIAQTPHDAKGDPVTAGVSRRHFLKSAAALGAALAVPGLASLAGAAPSSLGRNLIIILNDQERALQWFPQNWIEENLPAMAEMQRTGVTFANACSNTAMCTPSRASIFTGTYPVQNRCSDTLTEEFGQSETEFHLDPRLPNLATLLKSAGYDVVYKGKWHLSKGVTDGNGDYHPDNLARYGFDGWVPPDAGQDTKEANYGGGTADHDSDYLEQALDYLQYRIDNPGGNPFCLVISLVNPHDVLGYPGPNSGDDDDDGPGNPFEWERGGYTEEDLEGDLPLPPTVGENLSDNFKPNAHQSFLLRSAGLGVLGTNRRRRKYFNFYANLLRKVDLQIKQVLDLFEASEAGQALRRNTWMVRTSDHGEMGMSHGGLRQKAFQCYEESLRVPLVWSNPVDFPEGTGRVCQHLVSHVDLLPTICSLLGVPNWKSYNLPGYDYRILIQNPGAVRGVQDYILFTFDDIYAAADKNVFPDGLVTGANRIQVIRTLQYKYARYFDATGGVADEEEFYDLRPKSAGGTDTDADMSGVANPTGLPVEMKNYSLWATRQSGYSLSVPREVVQQRTLLQRNLQNAVRRTLVPRVLPAPTAPSVTQTAVTLNDQTPALELFWYSVNNAIYQVQKSVSGGVWVDEEGPIPGTNGPLLVTIRNPESGASYRVSYTARSV